MQKRLLPIAIIILTSVNIVAHAQGATPQATPTISAEKAALIRELIQITNSKEMVDGLMKSQLSELEKEMPDMVWQSVSGMPELKDLTFSQTAELKAKVSAATVDAGRRMYELMQQKIDFLKVIEQVSEPIYDKYFTAEELAALVTFYKTPTGRKVLDVSPQLFAESMSRTSELIMPKILEAMKELQEEETHRATDEIQATLKSFQKEPPATRPKPTRRRH